MVRRLSLLFGLAALPTTLFLTPANAHGPGGFHAGGFHYGGYYYPHHGYGFYGPYRPGLYAPYGFYRPYYPYGAALAAGGLGFGLGLGLGYGLGSYGGLGGYGGGLGGYGMYRPYYGGTTIVNPTTVVVAPPAAGMASGTGVPPVNQTPPPPDNAAHLQLIVPQDAEIVFNGETTTQTGPTREFVSPPLTPDKSYDYTIIVRYPDANGKTVTDRRVIHVRANDWYRVDFTRPAPPEPLLAP
jgi:uncharacterized protein (TIGR03000 family)